MTTPNDTTSLKQCSNGDNCVHPDGCLQPNDAEHFYLHRKRNKCIACERHYARQLHHINRDKHLEQSREWKRKNAERVTEYQARYREENRDAISTQKKHYCEQNRDIVAARKRRWYENNRDATTAQKARYREENREKLRQRRLVLYRQNPERFRASCRKWRKKNKSRVTVSTQYRTARVRSLPATFTTAQWQACLEYFHHTCAYCGAQQSFWHVLEQDHFTPISKDGGYTADNIVPACKPCNTSKHKHLAKDWLKQKLGARRATEILARIEAYFAWVKKQAES